MQLRLAVVSALAAQCACFSGSEAPVDAPTTSPNQEWAFKQKKELHIGVNLGGWLDIEPWMFDQGLLVQSHCELDYVNLLKQQGGEAVAKKTMQNHWQGFITDDILDTLQEFGVTHVRIPIGYWIFDGPADANGTAPLDASGDGDKCHVGHFSPAMTMGFQQEGFMTGGLYYLDQMLGKLYKRSIKAVLDLHALPGCSSKCQGYAGLSCAEPAFFSGKPGTTVPSCGGAPYASTRPSSTSWLELGVGYVSKMACWVQHWNGQKAHPNVVAGVQMANEPGLGEGGYATEIQDFYKAALASLKAGQQPVANFVGNSFTEAAAASFVADTLSTAKQPVLVDYHHYYNWDGFHDADAYETMVCNATEDWWAYHAKGISTFIGEWSLAVNGNANLHTLTSTSDVAFMKKFYANQISYYLTQPGSVGMYYWNVRMGSGWNPQTNSYATGTNESTSLESFTDTSWSFLELVRHGIIVPPATLNVKGRCKCHGCTYAEPPAPPALVPPSPPAPPPSPPCPPFPPFPPPSPPHSPSWSKCEVPCNAYDFDNTGQKPLGKVSGDPTGCGKACDTAGFGYFKYWIQSQSCICYKDFQGHAWPPAATACGQNQGIISGAVPGHGRC